jgi:rhamnose utilization protein RhaD (predicted bifunctional aldolase and dehydrogenase)
VDYRWDDKEASALADDLDRMVYLSRLVGGDPLLSQPGGGNTSIKWTEKDAAGEEVRVLRIKASGTDLASMERRGFAGLRLEGLRVLRDREAMNDDEMMALLDSCRLGPGEPIPSLETGLHAILPYRCIAHVHDLSSLALTDTSRRDAPAREALGDEAAYVGYARPGFPLARTTRALGDLGKARGLVMGKHGIAAWGGTPKECYDNLYFLVGRAEDYIERKSAGKDPFAKRRHAEPAPAERRSRAVELLPILRGALSRERKVIFYFDGSDEAVAFASSQRAKEIYRRGMATPEHVFRCGRMPLYVDAPLGVLAAPEAAREALAALDRFEADCRASFAKHHKSASMHDPRPRVLILPGLGVVTAGKSRRDAEVAGLSYRHVIRVIEKAEMIDQFRFLEEASSFELEYWPWEKVRPPAPERPLAGHVALVAEGLGGLGRAVAERLAGAGAHMAPPDPEEAVLACGGIDILVCGAGKAVSAEDAAVRAMGAQGGGTILIPAVDAVPEQLARQLAPLGIRVHGLPGGDAAAEAAISLAKGGAGPR